VKGSDRGLMPRALSLAGGARLALAADPAYAKPIRNLVIVHGMLEDGTGRCKIHDCLNAESEGVPEMQPPLTSFKNDAAWSRRSSWHAPESQSGPATSGRRVRTPIPA
jgi:hypothetical protein